jgi:hypothetical protein
MKKKCLILILFISLFINIISASSVGLIENSTWQNNLTSVRFPSISTGDIDNNGYKDIILIGCLNDGGDDCTNGVIAKVYTNNGTTLTENLSWEQNLTGVGFGSVSLEDINNDGKLDLSLLGCDSSISLSCNGNYISKIYINNGSTFTENSQWEQNLTGTFNGALNFGDVNNDGKLDLILIGQTISSNIAKIYINNGSTFTENSQWEQNLTGVYQGESVFGDVNNDGKLDLILTGDTGFTRITKTYLNNGTTLIENLIWSQSLLSVDRGSLAVGDINNDGYLDLDLIGQIAGDHQRIYFNNGTSFIENQTESEGILAGLYRGSIAFGDYDNDGDLDLAAMGKEAGRAAIYGNNQTNNYYFINDNNAHSNISNNIIQNALIWEDINQDGKLDIIISGADSGTGLLITKVYINNGTVNNTLPTPPSTFTSSYSVANNTLTLTWNNGSDNETPSTGLYYNLMVGNSTTNHTIVSGVYGGSSNPTAGYFGNMMQRKNITLNLILPEGEYYWYVQTIDTGLAKSAWSERQSLIVDYSSPVISGVSSSVTTTTATITWTTDEISNSTVYYGTTISTTSFSGDASLTQAHSITLNSLSASTLYYYNVSSCDASGNCNTSQQSTFTTSAAPPGGGGSPGGGGPGGGIIITNKTIPKFDIDFSNLSSTTLEAKQGDVKTFSFQGEITHKITTSEITTTSVKLIIESEPIILILTVGETKQIDINKDNINDIEISLISIISGKAKFSLLKLSGADIVAQEEIEESIRKDALFDAKISISNLFQIVKSGREVIAKIEVFNVNNIGQTDVTVNYYITSKEDNTTKLTEGSDTLAVEAVASFVRSLIVPYNTKAGVYYFNVEVKYKDNVMASSHAEFRVMRTYEVIITIGIFLLIVMAGFIYLWRIKKKEEKDVGMLRRQIIRLKNKEMKK